MLQSVLSSFASALHELIMATCLGSIPSLNRVPNGSSVIFVTGYLSSVSVLICSEGVLSQADHAASLRPDSKLMANLIFEKLHFLCISGMILLIKRQNIITIVYIKW